MLWNCKCCESSACLACLASPNFYARRFNMFVFSHFARLLNFDEWRERVGRFWGGDPANNHVRLRRFPPPRSSYPIVFAAIVPPLASNGSAGKFRFQELPEFRNGWPAAAVYHSTLIGVLCRTTEYTARLPRFFQSVLSYRPHRENRKKRFNDSGD